MKVKIDFADKAFSQLIRAKRSVCEGCHVARSTQIHHFKGRRYQSVRFNEENIFALCFFCHRKFHDDPDWGMAKMRKRLGERYDEFMIKASVICRRSEADKKLLALIFKKELNELNY